MENRWIRAACVGDTEELKRLLGLGMEAGRYLLFDSGMVSPVAEHVTALHLSAFGGHLEASQVLLRAGAEVNALTLPMEGIAGGDTPLMRAVWGHSEDVARLLLAAGAEVDAIDGLTGDTPLIAAARTGQHAMCLVLLEHGADLEAFNQDGEGALDLAEGETLAVLLACKAARKAERLDCAWAGTPSEQGQRHRL